MTVISRPSVARRRDLRASVKEALAPLAMTLLLVWTTVQRQQTSLDNSLWRIEIPASIQTIAYAITVTSCNYPYLLDGAAVLKHSIHRSSIQGDLGGQYDYKMYAFYHPSAETCASQLEKLGYTLLKREAFVKVSDIRGDYLRKRIEKNACCGEKELIKLESFTLDNFPLVVHLDVDSIVMQPMDEIFDLALHGLKPLSKTLAWPDKPLPERIGALLTFDYNMLTINVKKQHPRDMVKPVQGGFLVVRPNLTVYEELREIVLEGDFRPNGGWGGTGAGPFYGAMTVQGLLAYYYEVMHPENAVELNRCRYNQMADPPRSKKGNVCLTGEDECQDCRLQPIDEIVTGHFCICSKPWSCDPFNHRLAQANDQETLLQVCNEMTHVWFKIRSELEELRARPFQTTNDRVDFKHSEHFFGLCTEVGTGGYINLPLENEMRVAVNVSTG